MSKWHHITGKPLTLDVLEVIIREERKIKLSAESGSCIQRCREFLEKKLAAEGDIFYGINTGFGALCQVRINPAEIAELQHNLVLSHAAGTGERVPVPVVKLMLLLKIHALALGHSGIRLKLVERMIRFYNDNLIPVVYEQGSLGASGDLAPLAHLSLPLIGKGEVYYGGKKKDAALLLKAKVIDEFTLGAKEGLALLNGTQFMSAYGVWCLLEAKHILEVSSVIAALSTEGFDGRTDSFLPFTHRVRPHQGQGKVAARILELLQGSEISSRKKEQVQDPYSFRCIAQVHGAAWDTYHYVKGVIEVEVNSVTDNPILFPEEDKILSGGNFHGEPVALALDYLTIALAEIGNISERRTYLLQTGQHGLPPFLAAKPGLHSGLMIAQYTAAAIVSENKQKCMPASADSITSSNGQEDHVSMGANAATKLYSVIENVKTILAIELLCAVQALDFRRPLKSSPVLEQVVVSFRKKISFRHKDREIYPDIEKSRNFIDSLNVKEL